jgi:hypothetical protein
MAQPPWLPGTDRPVQQSRIFLRRNSKRRFSALSDLELRLHASSFLQAPPSSLFPLMDIDGWTWMFIPHAPPIRMVSLLGYSRRRHGGHELALAGGQALP